MYLKHKMSGFFVWLWYRHVGPIVNYDSYKSLNVERLHLGCCKHILGVKKSACTEVVYAESGRFPFFYHGMFALIKCCRKLLDSNWSIQRTTRNHEKIIL